MAANRSLLVLALVTSVLVAVLWWQFQSPGPEDSAGPEATRRAQTTGGVEASRLAAGLPRVELNRLSAPAAEPTDTGRDPFRFDDRSGRGTSGRTGEDEEPGTRAAGPSGPAVPQGPPPPPPIPLKFIGVVEQRDHGGRIAVLSDGRGVYHGREGDVVDGRYRILRIGDDSIEMSHLDGRGRQMIRLSGA